MQNSSIVNLQVTNSPKFSISYEGALDALAYFSKELNIQNSKDEFKLIDIITDTLSYTHIKLQQTANGFKVYGNQLIVHFNEKKEVYLINGYYDSTARDAYISGKLINKRKAEMFSKKSIGKCLLSTSKFDDIYLIYYKNHYTLAYAFTVSCIFSKDTNWKVFIDAYDGTTLFKYNDIKNNFR